MTPPPLKELELELYINKTGEERTRIAGILKEEEDAFYDTRWKNPTAHPTPFLPRSRPHPGSSPPTTPGVSRSSTLAKHTRKSGIACTGSR
jgi:hypothetical protein